MRKPGELTHQVDGVHEFLQVHQPDIPSALFFHHQAESLGSGAMAAARIKENEVSVDHASYLFIVHLSCK